MKVDSKVNQRSFFIIILLISLLVTTSLLLIISLIRLQMNRSDVDYNKEIYINNTYYKYHII